MKTQKTPPRNISRADGELVIGLRDELRELKAAAQERHDIVVRTLRRIEDRMDRSEEQQLALMRSDRDLENACGRWNGRGETGSWMSEERDLLQMPPGPPGSIQAAMRVPLAIIRAEAQPTRPATFR